MKYSYKALVLLAIFVTQSVFATEGSGPARVELERFAAGLERFQAEFTQVVKSQDGRIQDETQGKLWLQIPNKLRWTYSGEFPETIVADGKNIWIHDESLEQVTVKPQSDQASNSPLMILADISQLDQQFEVTELGNFEDMLLLSLQSEDGDSEFERIILGMDSRGIRLMVMEDAFGQRTEVKFGNPQRNLPADPALFTFTPPEGTDVVGVAALSE